MMDKAIRDFAKQFTYKPQIENSDKFKSQERSVLVGMGGSHLGGGILQSVRPSLDMIIHRDYGLPAMADKELQNRLIIVSSYSGNTEEVLSAFSEARERGLALIAIATGGKLIALAKEHSVSYIQIPATGIQPRSALGFSFLALLKAIGQAELLREAVALAKLLKPDRLESAGQTLAEKFKDHVPVIYASTRNLSVAYNWKIKLNETGKIPAFYNVLPELNHNEMTGFDAKESSKTLSEKFHFIFLQDKDDHSQIQKRMKVMHKLYLDRGLPVEVIGLWGGTRLEKIFSSLLQADWFAFYTAKQYGLESEQVPMVEEFKKLIK